MPHTLHLIYASTSGNTEFVVQTVVAALHAADTGTDVEVQRAEQVQPADLVRGDVVVLASGTWNTGGQEGQLNPLMHTLLMDRAKEVDLGGKPIAFISLGDDRYYFTTRCTEHFMRYMREHGGTQFHLPLIIVNEPYDQEEKIRKWAGQLAEKMKTL